MSVIAVAEQIVDVSLDVAFARFIDYSGWDQWMPKAFRPMSGPARALRSGDALTVGVGRNGKLVSALVVKRVRPNKELCWAGGVPGLLKAEHSIFFSESGGKTSLRSEDVMSGLITGGPLGGFLQRAAAKTGEQILSGFAAHLSNSR
jgi:hypothetical protein